MNQHHPSALAARFTGQTVEVLFGFGQKRHVGIAQELKLSRPARGRIACAEQDVLLAVHQSIDSIHLLEQLPWLVAWHYANDSTFDHQKEAMERAF
ncbi:hypothetical protein [Pseudomonas fluorescens]|uniref:hypothetical protein n=1 Tax=Pseudomonas fluorescens TaxID=294 RepID=UPI0012DA88C5|nr:hypothetical protein [Pseudomonas fluorescens]